MILVISLGTNPAVAMTSEEIEIGNLVRDYLSTSASVKYELSEADLVSETISEIPADSIVETQQKAQAKKASINSLISSISIDPAIGVYLTEKAEYIKYTREQENLYITNYSVTYGTPEITVDGDYANVKIFETVGMRYEGLDEDSAISSDYSIDLVKTSEGWKISNIESDDLFDRTHDRSFNCEDAIVEYNARMAEKASIVQEQAAPSLEELETVAAANGGKVYNYNHSNAAYYSYQYVTSTGVNTRDYYNSNFSNYASLGDCMNFASQCIFAGFGGSDSDPIDTSAIPMDRVGNDYYKEWYKDSGTWTGTLSFQSYCDRVDRKAGKPVPTENNLYVDMYRIGPNSAAINSYMTHLPGSVVFVLDKDGDLGHAMVIAKVTGSSSSQIFVSAHTKDVKLQPLSQCNSGYEFRLVVPVAYYAYTGVPSMRVLTEWKDNVRVGTSVTFTGRAVRSTGGNCFRMTMKVVSPSGKISWLGEKTNLSVYNGTITLDEKGLYKITTIAKEFSASPSNVSQTIALRTF